MGHAPSPQRVPLMLIPTPLKFRPSLANAPATSARHRGRTANATDRPSGKTQAESLGLSQDRAEHSSIAIRSGGQRDVPGVSRDTTKSKRAEWRVCRTRRTGTDETAEHAAKGRQGAQDENEKEANAGSSKALWHALDTRRQTPCHLPP